MSSTNSSRNTKMLGCFAAFALVAANAIVPTSTASALVNGTDVVTQDRPEVVQTQPDRVRVADKASKKKKKKKKERRRRGSYYGG